MENLTLNDRLTLLEIFQYGPRTQQQLAERLEVTQQSASRIIARLGDARLIQSGPRIGLGSRGYPTATVQLVERAACGLGLAVAPGSLTLVLANFVGTILATHRVPVLSPSRELAFKVVEDLGPQLVADADLPWSAVCGLGIAVSGSFQTEGQFNTPLSLEDWANHDVAKHAEHRLGMPAFADNDGNAAALAEAMLGAGRTNHSIACIYIAAGVGGGVILDGTPWRGRHGNAGEFAAGLQPGVNPFPSLELLRQVLATHGQAFDAIDDMLADYDPEWPAINEWIIRIRDSLSIIVSNIAGILDVEAIVLGGRLPASLAERLAEQLVFFDQRRRDRPRPVPRIVTSSVGSDSAAIGAAIMPMRSRFHV